MKPYYEDDLVTIYHGDCMELVPQLEQVNTIMADPPYYNVLDEAWDRQWATASAFIAWLGECADQWKNALTANGSLYCFASPQQAARVEVMISDRFRVLNSIRWVKAAGWHQKAELAALRSFLSPWEACVFAEQFGADGSALQGSGYDSACADLRAGVFEPLRLYLATERDAAGITNRQVDAHLGTSGMAGHYFSGSQWALPTEPVYKALRSLFNDGQPDKHLRREYKHLRREYEDLRREYEDLRREYEDLRRPFTISTRDQALDVWNFATHDSGGASRHPAAKPEAMLRHMVETSTRKGTTVLDPFMGSGTTLRAAKDLGRKAIGIEIDEAYCEIAAKRMGQGVLDFA
jgi:site-specific DNA-methyltransferase (adenine-specific)